MDKPWFGTRKSRRPGRVDITTDPGREIEIAQRWTRLHNEVAEDLNALANYYGGHEGKLLRGFLEIANFILKNTCGVGSNFKLADCRLADIDQPRIRKYYTFMLTLLAYHFGQLLPAKREAIWKLVLEITGDPESATAFGRELEECKDHQDGTFSPVRAGRKLWAHVAEVLYADAPEENATARIYYQTAPGQDLIFLVEKVVDEGWFQQT